MKVDKFYKLIELPEFNLLSYWTDRFKRIKLHYKLSEKNGPLSDIYLFRKLHMETHKYMYFYIPWFEVFSDQTKKNVKIQTDEELEAMEWLIKDHY